MKLTTKLSAAQATLLLPALASCAPVQASEDGGDAIKSNAEDVCYPETKDGELVAPCVSVNEIEQACQPNGSEPIHLMAHAQCMCLGSFFMDWRGCQNCLFVHGFRSARDSVY